MADETAKLDGNRVPSALGITDDAAAELRRLLVDPTTGRLKVSAVITGSIDHGGLAGLADDDHTQYHNDARALIWLGTRSTTDLPEGTSLYYTNERVDDRVAVLIQNGTGITWVYDDVANTLTPTVTITQYTDEMAQDTVANTLIQNGTGITWVYDDVANTLTPTVTITQYTDEMAQDTVANTLIQNGTGITWVYDDVANTLTPTVTITQYTDEMAQDTVGGALTDTATINLTYDDIGNAITADVIQAGLDHGSILVLADDYHTQYTRKDTLTTKGDIYAATIASTPA